MSSATPLLLKKVRRRDTILVVPAKPTPREFKPLSDIDDQQILRSHIPSLFVYKNNPSMARADPVKVIRSALAEALVFYYPFAGRLFEGPNKKLLVDCTSELGVPFVEADTDANLDQALNMIAFGCDLFDELFHNVPGSDGIIGCPLLLFQVTRFSCGGFTLAVSFSHTIADGSGFAQFVNAIAEFARGENLSVSPVWQREYFLAGRQPPRITCQHLEFEKVDETTPVSMTDIDNNNLIHRLFFFGPNDLETLRYHLPKQQQQQQKKHYSTFDVVAACLWMCRTRALELNPNQVVKFSCVANGRFTQDLKVPQGYYGNVFGYPSVAVKSGRLCSSPLGCATELIKEAKSKISGEYLRSLADFIVINERPIVDIKWNFTVADIRATRLDGIDFGWGKPILAGPVRSVFTSSFLMRFRDGIAAQLSLPEPIMERFKEELKKMLMPNRADQNKSKL